MVETLRMLHKRFNFGFVTDMLNFVRTLEVDPNHTSGVAAKLIQDYYLFHHWRREPLKYSTAQTNVNIPTLWLFEALLSKAIKCLDQTFKAKVPKGTIGEWTMPKRAAAGLVFQMIRTIDPSYTTREM